MAQFECSGLVSRPLGPVFEYLADPDNDAQWSGATRQVERTSPGPLVVGSTVRYVARLGGLRLDMPFVVTDLVPNSVIAVRTAAGRVQATGRRLVEGSDGQTRVTIAGELRVRGIIGRGLEPLVNWLGQRQLNADFARLLERLQALPQV
ncbi:MAG: SRPBCC family protein [Solirubrobacteraceae bacterium]